MRLLAAGFVLVSMVLQGIPAALATKAPEPSFGPDDLAASPLDGTHSLSPPVPGPITLVQPDDQSFEAWELGGEEGVQVITSEEYTILKDQDGWWVYAIPDGEGGIRPSGLVVGQSDPAAWDVPKLLAPPNPPKPAAIGGSFVPSTGTIDVIAIRARFSDITFDTTARPDAFFTSALGNVSAYYTEVSYGLLTLNPALAASTYNLGTDGNGACNTMANYGTGDTSASSGCPTTLIQDTLAAADSTINFALYDAVIIIHAGIGDESNGGGDDSAIWSVRRSFTAVTYDGVPINSATVIPEYEQGLSGITGVTAHEFGHDLGLPDLYDADGAANGESWGTGDWDLMSYGTWNLNGHNPAHLGAWCKYVMGWVAPEVVTRNREARALSPVETSPTILAFTLNPAGTEHFLVEYRSTSAFARGSAATYDKGIPGSGILVWHVNESAYGNRVAGSLRVDLEEADGAQELEAAPGGNTGESTDPFYSGNGGQFSRTSSPNSNAYDGSANGLRLYGFGVPGATITLSYEFARIRLGHESASITMAAGAESFQQYRLFSPYGANRLVARSFAGSSNSVDLYANKALPASASAFVDKSDSAGTSAEIITIDSGDAPPLPTSPGWWFVNVTGAPGETVSFKVESEVTTLYEGAERAPVGPSLNGWWESLRNLSLGGWNPARFMRSTFSVGSGSYSYNVSYPGGAIYTCCTDTVLYSPLLNLSKNAAPVLSFRTNYNFQCGEVLIGTHYRCDGFWLEASVAGSGVWGLLTPVNDYPMNTDSASVNSNTLDPTYSGLPGQKAFTQESGGWQKYTVYLSGYAGQNIFLRVRFWANPVGYYIPATPQFLYIDQISVTSRIVINEVLAAESVRREFVEIHNPFGVSVDLDGWRVRDGNGGLDFTFPSALDPLASGAYLWLQGGTGADDYVSTDGTAMVHTGVNGVLAEADDSITLFDDRGGEVDFVRFGSSANDVPAFAFWTGSAPANTAVDDSYGRNQDSLDTDDSSDWDNTGGVNAAGPTPGGRNLGAAIPESGFVAVAAVAGVVAIGVRISSSRRRKGTL